MPRTLCYETYISYVTYLRLILKHNQVSFSFPPDMPMSIIYARKFVLVFGSPKYNGVYIIPTNTCSMCMYIQLSMSIRMVVVSCKRRNYKVASLSCLVCHVEGERGRMSFLH